MTLTYSYCVEHPFQRLLLAIDAHLKLRIYEGDASDAFKHIPGPYVPTFVSIGDKFADCYRQKFGNNIDRGKVIPEMRYLKEHSESGRLWETLINQILKRMGFNTTTHDRTIYTPVYNTTGETIYLLRQVDDFVLACAN